MQYESSFSPFMRIISAIVIVTFTMLILQPTAMAAQVMHEEYKESVAQSAKEEAAKLADTLKTVEASLLEWRQTDNTRRTRKVQDEARTLRQQVQALDEYVKVDFNTTADHLLDKQLPAEIMQRHQEAEQVYKQNLVTLLSNLAAIETATDSEQLSANIKKALNHLQPLQTEGKHPEFDPNNLPFNVPTGDVRPPLETAEELRKLFPTDSRTRRPQTPDSSYLAATEDVQITPEIEALALELEHNPVKIYNWVHDNIKFIPTYGSIQGSQMTLDNKAGNAFDTASLLLALLRASGIHSKYAYGTVRIPIDKVMNWVGGVTAPEAATQLLGQGGIPVKALAQNGKIALVQMEHAWVDAWVDFVPSRGTKHKTGDSWIPLDASFKQYEFTEGMDIQANVPFDAEGFAEQITNAAQINEAEGWVSGIDQSLMETTLKNYQTQMEEYITQTNPDATVGEVLGTQIVASSDRSALAAGLPYVLHAKGGSYQELPAKLRSYFKFSLYANETNRVLDEPALHMQKSLPELAGKRLTLSFEPASDSDRQVIESYLPDALPEGQELDLESLPTSLPGYLINLKAQLKVAGEVVAESGSFKMGQELSSTTGITQLTGGWNLASNKPIVGEFYAIGIDLQGISSKQLEDVKTRMESVKTKLENQQFDGLTKDGLIGDMLYAGALSYFAANDMNLQMVNKGKQALSYRLPSFGTFSTNLNPVYSFGVPRQVEMSGVMVDMDVVNQSVWTKDNDVQLVKTVVQQIGMQTSAWEHKIPEMLFSSDKYPGEAVSAMKALGIAAAEGQRIYQITKDNVDAVLPVLNIGSEVKREIRDSVAVGKVATVSQNNIMVGSWTGVGYIIADADTGAGAYRISGGSNGGEINGLAIGSLLGLAGLTSVINLLSKLGMVAKVNPYLFLVISAIAFLIATFGNTDGSFTHIQLMTFTDMAMPLIPVLGKIMLTAFGLAGLFIFLFLAMIFHLYMINLALNQE